MVRSHELPAPADAGIEELVELRDGLLRVFALDGGRRYAAGIVTPEDMWSDDLPLRLRASRSADGLWPAGYEMRWWTRDYDVGADVLVFGGIASGARVLRGGSEHRLSSGRRSVADALAATGPAT